MWDVCGEGEALTYRYMMQLEMEAPEPSCPVIKLSKGATSLCGSRKARSGAVPVAQACAAVARCGEGEQSLREPGRYAGERSTELLGPLVYRSGFQTQVVNRVREGDGGDGARPFVVGAYLWNG